MAELKGYLFLWKLAFIYCIVVLNTTASAQTTAAKLDDFNRANSWVLGATSGHANLAWQETETANSNNFRARIENNMLVLGSYNNLNIGSAGQEQASVDISNRYATIFDQASSEMTWAFNFRQNRSGTSGFGSTTYGIAYILGTDKPAFTDPDALGYAVVIGNSGSPDPVKLVRFKNGLTANSNLTTLITSSEITETAYYSVKVTFEPCTKNWTLQVRNDNGAFADPLTISTVALSAADQTYTNLNLNYTGAAYNHGTANVTAYFDNVYVPTATILAPVQYTWTGLVSTNSQNSANWSPARNCARATDKLVFNQGGNVVLSNLISQETGQLWVSNNTSLYLKTASGTTQTFSLAGGTGEDLRVESGSELIIDSNDPLEINLKAGATASVSGNIIFQNTAANLGRAHRLLAADANAIVFENGSQFIAKNLTGEPFGNSGASNAVVFKANATYVSKDGASPFGLASPNSKVVFETGSLYKHEQTGTAPKLDGRVYADFELNVTNNLAIIFGTSAATTTRIDNFTISSGNMNVTLASGNTALPMHIKGNFIVMPGASFNFLPNATVNTSLISFNGQVAQQVSGTLNLGTFANLEIDNPAGVFLNSPLTINGNMVFTRGNVWIGPAASLTFGDNATASGASNLSYVAGKVIKTGNDAFIFPVGKNGFYAPVAISAPLNVADQFAAEYFNANPKTVFNASITDSLVDVSDSEYWDVARLAGNSDVKITLSYDAARSKLVANPQDLRIAHFRNATAWVNEGLATVGTTPVFTFYATRNAQAAFSPFTFGTISGAGPLPVTLVHFKAERLSESVHLSWETASELHNDRFEIERSSDGRIFKKIGEVAGQGNSNVLKRYVFADKNPSTARSYYRLKQIDYNGTFSFSKIVSVAGWQDKPVIKVFPNPAQHYIWVSGSGNIDCLQLEILDIMGKPVKAFFLDKAVTDQQLDITALPAGTYFLRTTKGEVIRFLKVN